MFKILSPKMTFISCLALNLALQSTSTIAMDAPQPDKNPQETSNQNLKNEEISLAQLKADGGALLRELLAKKKYRVIGDAFFKSGNSKYFERAQDCYLKASRNGDDLALFSLARLFHLGMNGEYKFFNVAERYYLMAAEELIASDRMAIHSTIAYMFQEEGKFQDLNKAKKYHLMVAEEKPTEDNLSSLGSTYFQLGSLYQKEWEGNPVEPEKTVYWFTKCLNVWGLSNAEFRRWAREELASYLIPSMPAEPFTITSNATHPSFMSGFSAFSAGPGGLFHYLPIGENVETKEQTENCLNCLQPLAGKMLWKCGEYSQANSMKTNKRGHKPQGQNHYEMYAKTLESIHELLPTALTCSFGRTLLVFMKPKMPVLKHLCSQFKVYDPLNPTSSDHVSLRLYKVGDNTLFTWGNENVKYCDKVMNILEGKEYSLASLIKHHQTKLGLLEKCKTQRTANLKLDEESCLLLKNILTKPALEHLWQGETPWDDGKSRGEPKPSFSSILKDRLRVGETGAQQCIDDMISGVRTNVIAEEELIKKIDAKIAKCQKKIALFEGIGDYFHDNLMMTQPMRGRSFKDNFPEFRDMF